MRYKLAFGVEPGRRRYRLRLARYKELAETIKSYVESLDGQVPSVRLLDVGVGNGRTMAYLDHVAASERIQFFGVDNDARRLEGLYDKQRWTACNADVTQGLPYEDAYFDVVVCEQVIEHLSDPSVVLHEIARVAKPGSLVILGVPTFPPGLAAVRRRFVPLFDRLTGKSRGHAQVFTKSAFVRAVQSSGKYEIQCVRGFRFISGGPLAPLEDFKWWYALNRWLGRRLAFLCTEIQVVSRRILTCILVVASECLPL